MFTMGMELRRALEMILLFFMDQLTKDIITQELAYSQP
jgi:hypothetical protein